MINLKEFKQSVLQEAMQGKLTKQLPSDGNASDLLVKIANYKRDLVQHGKAKGYKKPLSPVTDKEMILNIPDNWKWTRLGNVSKWESGGQTPKKNISDNFNGNIPWVRSGDLNDSMVYHTDITISSKAVKNYSLKVHKRGTVLIARAGNVSKLGILGVNATYNDQCFSCVPYMISNKFIFYYLLYKRNNLISISSGSAQRSLAITKLRKYPIPLPPLSEQKRIVAKVHKCFELADTIQKERELNKRFAHDMKQSLLTEAMQGKLTKQLPSDGTADELVQKIQQKKQELIKVGKIRRHKKLPPISKDEIPSNFNIPRNWKWVRLGDIASLENGDRGKYYPSKKYWVDKGMPFLNAGSLNKDGSINKNNVHHITINRYKLLRSGFIHKGDILYTLRGSIGKVSLNSIFNKGAIASSLTIIHDKYIDSHFLLDVFLSHLNNLFLNSIKNGTAQPNVSARKLSLFKIPLPPLSEQKRIIKEIKLLFSKLQCVSHNSDVTK